ncbi:MAG1210 family protein [Mycoplasma capricolum]|uniref:MAG1210 family protein n=1 Tax=Mycoplasma capricolum TaxID=2095 RepID=UPI003DA3AE93
MENNEFIFEPLKEYDKYEEKNLNIIKEYFDNLIKTSQVDLEQNQEQVIKINKKEAELKQVNSSLKRLKAWSIFNIVLICLSGLFGAFFIWTLTTIKEYKWYEILICIIVLILFIVFLVIQFVVINKKKKVSLNTKNIQQEKLNQLIQTGLEQTQSLRNLIKIGTKNKLLTLTMPFIKLNKHLGLAKLNKLINEYGFINPSSDDQKTTLYVKSGSINNNSFLLTKEYCYEVVKKTYYGSLTISWTESYTDSDGNIKKVTKTQVLTASVVKPFVEFSHYSRIYFATDLALNLQLYRKPQQIDKLTEKEKDKLVKKTEKELHKYSQKNLNFTPLSNTKFEAFWSCFNRNNEREFRLLFTPLAQQNLVELVQDNKKSFGDNYHMLKINKWIVFATNNLDYLNFYDYEKDYDHYNIEHIKNNFYSINNNYFKTIYWTLAPYFSIPSLVQTSLEYKDEIQDNLILSDYEHEVCANLIPSKLLDHPNIKTDSIIKTNLIASQNNIDYIQATSIGFDIVPRIDYIPVLGGDGWYHNVPVPWDEFIKYTNTINFKLKIYKNSPIDDKLWDDEVKNKYNESDILTEYGAIEIE